MIDEGKNRIVKEIFIWKWEESGRKRGEGRSKNRYGVMCKSVLKGGDDGGRKGKE